MIKDETIDKLIQFCIRQALRDPDGAYEMILTALRELTELRESNLRPADKFLPNTPDEQLAHVCSEYHEFWNEWVDWVAHRNRYPEKAKIYIQRMVEEGIDLQMSIETLLARFGLDEQQRRKERKKVLAKNAARGYYVIGG